MNKSKRTGTGFEVLCVSYLRDHGFPWAERRAQEGVNDRGDVSGIPGVVIECKAEKAIDLAGYMGELKVEMANAKVDTGFVVVKRRMHSVDQAYAVLPFEQMVRLIGP